MHGAGTDLSVTSDTSLPPHVTPRVLRQGDVVGALWAATGTDAAHGGPNHLNEGACRRVNE